MNSSIQTIPVRVGKGYQVQIGSGLLARCGTLLAQLTGPCRMAVITDSSVAPLYLHPVEESLRQAGFEVCSYTFPAGESSKNFRVFADILEFLAREQLTRSDCVVALGGGVCGDMAGFAAGCYLRGIHCVQLPTTLLAAVDSSVGGKTAIDLAAGKNLAGLFLQPSAVLCDTDCLRTLPPALLADGAAEAIKTGVLADEALFSRFDTDTLTADLDTVISQCISYKAGVVERDEKEQDERRLLNLGHTIGHAIEACSNYAISHGHAVAAGLSVISHASAALGFCDVACANRISSVLARNHLPTSTEFSAQELTAAALSDKKRSGGEITLVLPQRIGTCLLRKFPVTELEGIIAAGLEGSHGYSH